jgi:hypothetical protein
MTSTVFSSGLDTNVNSPMRLCELYPSEEIGVAISGDGGFRGNDPWEHPITKRIPTNILGIKTLRGFMLLNLP